MMYQKRAAVAAVMLALGALAGCGPAGSAAGPTASSAAKTSAGELPCDIYASGGTPCVAAHSTTRALYRSYNGPLYQVKRNSDAATANISTLTAGGYANAAEQDSFCAGTYCAITEIYDQSGHRNNLTPGMADGAIDANAAALPARAGGHEVYGVFTSPGMGYRDNSASGVPKGDDPEGEYAVFGGAHTNNGCCYDYGNAETTGTDAGAGHMEAIYFGTANTLGPGSGPWTGADLENGLFARSGAGQNSADRSMTDSFVTAMVKGQPHEWSIRDGNAASGGLSTVYSGARPSGYDPMHKEGAIILGIGGDNANQAAGSFFEGALTSGYPSDAVQNAVQASIAAAGYTTPPATPFTPGARVSLNATTPCCTADYIAHDNHDDKVELQTVNASSPPQLKADATWKVVPGLANASCVSLESVNEPGKYLRHSNFQLYLSAPDSPTFTNDATFCPRRGNSGNGYSLMSNNFSDHYIRHYDGVVYAASDGGPKPQDATAFWPDDSSWIPRSPWS